MTYANPTQHQPTITRLRALADFLASRPEIPAPPSTDALVFPPFASASARRQEIDLIASHIGMDTEAVLLTATTYPAPQAPSS
jgi:hypothetical protein